MMADPTLMPAEASPETERLGPMLVVRGLRSLNADIGRLFLVVGVFDGIHRGHTYLLGQLRRQAGRRGARPAVITFDAHPDEVLVGQAPPLICDPEERLARLAVAGVEVTVVEHFDDALRTTPYDEFIRLISARTPLDGLLMTPDAAFGYQRRGTPEALAELGSAQGFEVVVVPPFSLEGSPVSSSAIRAAVAGGALRQAAHLLGRPYAVVGDGRRVADSVRLEFGLPVALPPGGDYAVDVQEFGMQPAPLPVRMTGAVADGAIEIHGWRDEGRVRVAFPGKLTEDPVASDVTEN